MPTFNITLSLPQEEIDRIREAAGEDSLADLTVQALRRELRERHAAAYRSWNESLPDEVKADPKTWDDAPILGWGA